MTQTEAKLREAGYTYEYPGFWLRTVNDVDIVIAVAPDESEFEVQLMRDGECIGADVFQYLGVALQAAIDWTSK